LIFNCEVIKTESCDRWYYFARPLGLALLTLWHSMAHSLQQKYSFTPHNKNNKARCKKYFLLVKTTIPICVNRKLLRMKSTAKQENNWNFWKKSFSHWYVQTLAPGVCNSTNSIRFKLQPKIPVISKRGCKGSAYYKIGICKVFFTHSCTVAILEIKKWGRHYGVNDKVGGATQMSILHGDFSLFWRSSCYNWPYQTQHRLVNIAKYELSFYYSLGTPKRHCRCNHTRILLCRKFCANEWCRRRGASAPLKVLISWNFALNPWKSGQNLWKPWKK